MKNKYTFPVVVQPIQDVVYHFEANSSAVAEVSGF